MERLIDFNIRWVAVDLMISHLTLHSLTILYQLLPTESRRFAKWLIIRIKTWQILFQLPTSVALTSLCQFSLISKGVHRTTLLPAYIYIYIFIYELLFPFSSNIYLFSSGEPGSSPRHSPNPYFQFFCIKSVFPS